MLVSVEHVYLVQPANTPFATGRMEFYRQDYHAIIAVLERGTNRHDAFAVRRTCHELARLVLWKRKVRLEMIEADLLRQLAPVIEYHVESDADVIVDFCRFLRRCISHKEPTELDIQSKVAEAGFLRIFHRALEVHVGRMDLFDEVCRVLALLCFDMPNAPHSDNQLEIADNGLLELLLDRLREPNTLGEDNAALACEVVLSVIYENEATSSAAVNNFSALNCFAGLMERFPSSPSIVQSTTRTVFQLMTVVSGIQDDIADLHLLERTLDFLELHRHGCDALLLWHAIKFLELAVRNHEVSKDEFCRCRGPSVVIQAIQYFRAAAVAAPPATRAPLELLACLYYVGCMLFSELAMKTGGGELTGPTQSLLSSQVFPPRVGHLIASSAHQFALQILKATGSEPSHVAEQAVRLLEIIALIESNRIPLTRLGASRQVKVIYNTTAHPGLQCLCERAIAAIEGT